MKLARWSTVVSVAGVVLLTACASSPTNLHTLSRHDIAPTPPTAAGAYAISLSPVSVPRGVDVPQLVVMQSDGSARLAESQRWMAPLADEIRVALSQQIQPRLGVSDLSGVSVAAGLRVYVIRVDVQRFEALTDGSVHIVAAWSLRDAAQVQAAASCVSRVRDKGVAADYAARVEGFRRALAVVAENLSAGIAALEKNPATSACPIPSP